MRWCRGSTPSCRWTCTCRAARRAPKGCCTACCSCTRRSRANRCSTACRGRKGKPLADQGCASPPSRSTRSRTRSGTPSTSSARREPVRRRAAGDLRREHRDRPRARIVRRYDRLCRTRSAARCDGLAARHARTDLRLPGGRHRGRVPRPGATARGGVRAALAGAPRRSTRQSGARSPGRPHRRLGRAPVARRRLARARGVRHVRHHLPGAPRPAPHPHVGDVCRRVPAAQGFSAARTVQPGRAGPPGAGRPPRGPLLVGGAVDRRSIRGAPRGHEGAAAAWRARHGPGLGMSKRTVALEVATPGVDARGQPLRVPLGVAEPDLAAEHMLINIGPQHPATHGVLRLVVELDGETVVRVIPHLGYLHSGFEKLGEYRHYNQIIPLTDRTDYLSPMANNVGFALAAERLMGLAITPRCTVLRVIACEMSRIISHMVWLGTTSIDLGAFTPFLWAFQERERIYNLQEMWTGARLTTSVTRLGGMMADVPDGFVEGLRHFTRTFPRTLSEIDRVLTRKDRKSTRLNSSHSQISYSV